MLRALTPFRCAAAVALATVATSLTLTSVAASSQRAHAAASCKLSRKDYTSFGYSYMQRLWVYNTSCGTGRTVAKHHGHVRGWRCTQQTLDRSPVQYNAKETCTSGREKVVWQYTQNT